MSELHEKLMLASVQVGKYLNMIGKWIYTIFLLNIISRSQQSEDKETCGWCQRNEDELRMIKKSTESSLVLHQYIVEDKIEHSEPMYGIAYVFEL